MATKFRIKVPRIRFVNRCAICGAVIPPNWVICAKCSGKMRRRLR